MSDLVRNCPPKPVRGEAQLARREKHRELKRHERREMDAALRRDMHKCRYPGCHYTDLTVHACHQKHRGMGGNPKGDRTRRATCIAFCAIHHGWYDLAVFDVWPQTERIFDGPVDFAAPDDQGRWAVVASETVIGVSVAVGR